MIINSAMIKILVLLFGIFVSSSAYSQDISNSCHLQIPQGLPSTKGDITTICRYAYIVAHDNQAKIPLWVTYRVEPKNAIGCVPRLDRFIPDYRISESARSHPEDYAGTGYDIGHMADAASMSWSDLAEEESFIMSNAAPQAPNLNRGIWKLLEIKIRVWAWAGRDMTVYTGSVYDEASEHINNKVTVPDKFYKIVVDNTTGESIAFLFNNEPTENKDLTRYIVPVSVVEAVSGLEFPNIRNKDQEGILWPADSRKFRTDKRKKCSIN